MIRLILVLLFLIPFLIISLPIQGVEYLIGKKHPMAKSKSSLAIVLWAFRIIIWLSGTKVDVIGEENVPKEGAVVYIGNHRSIFDIILTYVRVPHLCGYVAKDVLAKVPSLNTWMRYLHCLFLNRSDVKEGMKTIMEAIKNVKSGISMVIYPEGTRNKTDEDLQEFHAGSFKIATKSGAPIIPMTINNSEQVMEAHFPYIRRAHVIIEYGAPVEVAGLSKEEQAELPDKVRNIILSTYQKNKALV